MSLALDIIAKHTRSDSVKVGDIVTVAVDRVYIQDGNAPTIRRLFQENQLNSIFNKDKIAVFFDHSVLPPTIAMADRLKEAKEFCLSHELRLFNQAEGISHLVAIEQGWFEPGGLVVATDSHTCTGGVMQSLALGMGASDVVAAMVTGKTWLKVPETVWIQVKGIPSKHATAKDVILFALSLFKDDTFLYKSIEWCGQWCDQLSFDQASTIANMGVEMGAKCVFMPPWKNAPERMKKIVPGREGKIYELAIDGLTPFVAKPNSPYQGVPLAECAGEKINYVYVGSCANSRIEDLQVVANILKHQTVHPKTTLIVTPGSKKIYLEAMQLGYIETIMNSGGIVTPPGCGSCVGTQGPIPATGDKILSTMNRNFLGRMGNAAASIWLSSPLVAACTAIKGEIPRLEDLDILC